MSHPAAIPLPYQSLGLSDPHEANDKPVLGDALGTAASAAVNVDAGTTVIATVDITLMAKQVEVNTALQSAFANRVEYVKRAANSKGVTRVAITANVAARVVEKVTAHIVANVENTAKATRLKSRAHVLNGECTNGADLCWLQGQGWVVTASDSELAAAKVASQRAGQPVRVGPLDQFRSVLPYDGIWLSRPLMAGSATLVTLLGSLTALLKPGAPLCFSLVPTLPQMQTVPQWSGLSSLPQDHGHDAPLVEWLRQLIYDAALPLEIDMVGQGGWVMVVKIRE
ncbi:MAG: hypothetical protein ACRC6D_01885 [Aeromonas sp.]